jgi:hypothetical protein
MFNYVDICSPDCLKNEEGLSIFYDESSIVIETLIEKDEDDNSEESCSLFYYIFPNTDTSVHVLINIDDCTILTEIYEHFFDENYQNAILNTWKLTSNLIINGLKNKISKGAFIIVTDDDGEEKLCLAKLVSNVDSYNIDSLINDNRVIKALNFLDEIFQEVIKEIQENKLQYYNDDDDNDDDDDFNLLVEEFTAGFVRGVTRGFLGGLF